MSGVEWFLLFVVLAAIVVALIAAAVRASRKPR